MSRSLPSPRNLSTNTYAAATTRAWTVRRSVVIYYRPDRVPLLVVRAGRGHPDFGTILHVTAGASAAGVARW